MPIDRPSEKLAVGVELVAAAAELSSPTTALVTEVLAAQETNPGELAVTGVETGLALLTGVGLISAGLAMTMLSRRRTYGNSI